MLTQANDKIFDLLQNGEYLNIIYKEHVHLNEVRTKLSQNGASCVMISLDEFEGLISEEKFYYTIADIISDRLEIDIDLENWWIKLDLTPTLSLLYFIKEFVLPEFSSLVIFIDRLEGFLKLKEQTIAHIFLHWVRGCYEERTVKDEYKRISFCLSGLYHPNEILKMTAPENEPFTPFNIGETIKI